MTGGRRGTYTVESSAAPRRLRIGEAAQRAGVSTRTLRYYEQLGLLPEAPRTPGGNRSYTDHDVETLLRIRDLQTVVGLDLDQIRTVVEAERRIDELRTQWRRGVSRERQEAILNEAIDINGRLRGELAAKRDRLDVFLRDLEVKAGRYREIALEHGLAVAERPPEDGTAG